MAKMIQVRNVPDDLHRALTRRARQEGRTLTQYIEAILRREVARPSPQEVFRRIARSSPVDLRGPASEMLHEERTQRKP